MEDNGRTRRWAKLARPETDLDPERALRACIAQLKQVPRDLETRRQLRAIAEEQGLWEALAGLLVDEARAATHQPELALVFYEELVDVHEQLDQELEMIAALESIVALDPQQVDQLDRLAWLYRRAGAWAKAAEAFEQVGERSRDNRARAALRAAAQLYREHRRLDRAAEVYRAIVDRRPSDDEAWRALDDVLGELGRWREVAGVRAERASRVDGVEKAALLRAQARALERAGDPAAAAALVARATQHAPENVSGLVDYVEVLAQSGRHREAAALLRERIAASVDPVPRDHERAATEPSLLHELLALATPDPEASPAVVDDVAGLRLRLVRLVDAYDPAEAATLLDELIAEAPAHVGARELRVAHAARAGEAAAHAAALVQYAAVVPPGPTRVAALRDGARRYREAGDTRGALRAYEAASDGAPDDDELRGELDEARTALVVERAATDAAAGDLASAERRLRTALAGAPLHVAGNLALAELLGGMGRHADAAAHLQSTLAAAPVDAPGPQLATLVHRYATVMAVLGEPDAAHQLLHEAHRLDRGDVVVTLALGESCFARRLWRQAAIHLGSLAEHPAAAAHARAIAAGLVQAGQAEVRGLRPANAPRHYAAAVRLDPDCAGAWHELGALAMERGAIEEAARCLEREAQATLLPRDRLRLFDALGDLARDVLHDDDRAERCWAAVAALGDAGVLAKLLALQRTRGATTARGETAERLAAVVADASQRQALLVEAAQAHAHGGNLAHARDVAERVLAAQPLDVDAIGCASALALAAGDFADARAMLRRALGAWDATGDRGNRDGKRAELWRRAGDAERALGDPAAALAAYRTAVNLAPDSEGALAARRGLVELAAAAGRVDQAALGALVERAGAPADVLASARNLAASGAPDDARAMFELAHALGARLTGEDRRAYEAHPPRTMASDEGYSAALDEADRRALVDDAADAPLAEVLELLAEVAPRLLPDARTALAEAGLGEVKRLVASRESAAAALFPQIAKAFGGPPTLLHVAARREADVTLLLASPPVVVLGARFAQQRPASRMEPAAPLAGVLADDVRSDAALRFHLGRTVELTRLRRLFAAGTSADAFGHFVRALWLAAGRTEDAGGPGVIAQADVLRGKLPVALRQQLAARLPALAAIDAGAYAAGCQRAADRVGLLACGDVAVAIALAGGAARAPHLVRLASAQRYLAVRRRLRLAAR